MSLFFIVFQLFYFFYNYLIANEGLTKRQIKNDVLNISDQKKKIISIPVKRNSHGEQMFKNMTSNNKISVDMVD